jgi:predicted secreted hydrolase
VPLVAILVAACGGGPILANPPATQPSMPLPTAEPTPPADPLPIVFPRDDGAHERLMEWWYYTGHLRGHAQTAYSLPKRFGFEFVIFRAERGTFPTSWASHFALTDESGERFHYAQRVEVGDTVDRSEPLADGTTPSFDFELTGGDPSQPATLERPPWQMSGTNGSDRLRVSLAPDEAAAAGLPSAHLSLDLESRKPPALHDRDGWIDFGAAGGSYYYSRTAMDATGALTLGNTRYVVEGDAWFDHQWGDFITLGGGGWDWFAINLEDGTDITLSQIRDADGSYPLVYGTVVDARGTTRHLEGDDFTIESTRQWTSSKTGAIYPAAWHITMPGESLVIDLVPTVADQELDTRPSTGVVYWEGSQLVTARRGPLRRLGYVQLGGEAYVELTGYAPAGLVP